MAGPLSIEANTAGSFGFSTNSVIRRSASAFKIPKLGAAFLSTGKVAMVISDPVETCCSSISRKSIR